MKWKKFVALSIILPVIVGLCFATPFILNWQRNKDLVEQQIEDRYNNDVPPEIVKPVHSLMKTLVDAEFIPAIYQAFGFGYCITLLILGLYYLNEQKIKNHVKR